MTKDDPTSSDEISTDAELLELPESPVPSAPHADEQEPASAGAAARLRAEVATRRDASALLAEATRTRDEAFVEADALVHEAQDVSERLVADSRERSDGILAQARAEAARLVEAARGEADQMRRSLVEEREQARAEARAEALQDMAGVRMRAEQLISDIETSLHGLGSMLMGAGTTVQTIERTASDLSAATDDLLTVETAHTAVARASAQRSSLATVGSAAPSNGSSNGSVDNIEPTYDQGPPPSFDCEIEEILDQDLGSPYDEVAKATGHVRSAGLPAGRGYSDVALEEPLRLQSTATAGRSGYVGRSEGFDSDLDDDLDEALAAARPLGWLFRGN